MMQSLVDAARQENGWLPRWALVNGPTSVMGGDSIDPVIAGAYAFGARDFDARAALDGHGQGRIHDRAAAGARLVHSSAGSSTTSICVAATSSTRTRLRFRPFPTARRKRSSTRSTISRSRGSPTRCTIVQTYAAFMRRSANWMTLFDGADRVDRSARSARRVHANADRRERAERLSRRQRRAVHLDGSAGSARPRCRNGRRTAATVAKLDDFFTQLNAGQDKPYAWLGNEPSLGCPWVYLSAGEPWRAQADRAPSADDALRRHAPTGFPATTISER